MHSCLKSLCCGQSFFFFFFFFLGGGGGATKRYPNEKTPPSVYKKKRNKKVELFALLNCQVKSHKKDCIPLISLFAPFLCPGFLRSPFFTRGKSEVRFFSLSLLPPPPFPFPMAQQFTLAAVSHIFIARVGIICRLSSLCCLWGVLHFREMILCLLFLFFFIFRPVLLPRYSLFIFTHPPPACGNRREFLLLPPMWKENENNSGKLEEQISFPLSLSSH